jgi:hypothetical protein
MVRAWGPSDVASGERLLPPIREAARKYLNAYLSPLDDAAALDRYICGPGLADHSGLAGAFLLTQSA